MIRFNKTEMAELIFADDKAYLIKDNIVKEIGEKIKIVEMGELAKSIETQKTKNSVMINPKVFEILKKEIGDFEIVI